MILMCMFIEFFVLQIQLWDMAVDVGLTYNQYLDADQTPNLIGYWK